MQDNFRNSVGRIANEERLKKRGQRRYADEVDGCFEDTHQGMPQLLKTRRHRPGLSPEVTRGAIDWL